MADVRVLRREVGVYPEKFGDAFARTFYRAVGGAPVTFYSLDSMAVTLGLHVSELLADGERL